MRVQTLGYGEKNAPNGHGKLPPLMMKPIMPVSLMNPLATPLGC